MERRAFLLNNLRTYPDLSNLKRSAFFAECGREIESLLAGADLFANPEARQNRGSFLRVVEWNIEKGRHFDALLRSFQSSDVLKRADVVLLNEADWGMNRSGNIHVARGLAQVLGMNMAFGPAHIELTRGTGDDLILPGENTGSLQGNAVLSRFPILEARVIPLPVCFEPYEFYEKRYGRRNCVWAKLQVRKATMWAGSTHLEVRNTPSCRATQMEYLLRNLPGETGEPCLLGGDFNTNSFRRGNRWRTIKSIWRLVMTPPGQLKEQLCHPERGSEPLFRAVRAAGFFWQGLNSFDSTASAPLADMEDSRFIPKLLVKVIQDRLRPHAGYLHFKLDWLLGRDVHALKYEEFVDGDTGIPSLAPGCVQSQRIGIERISDHAPIYADLRIG